MCLNIFHLSKCTERYLHDPGKKFSPVTEPPLEKGELGNSEPTHPLTKYEQTFVHIGFIGETIQDLGNQALKKFS